MNTKLEDLITQFFANKPNLKFESQENLIIQKIANYENQRTFLMFRNFVFASLFLLAVSIPVLRNNIIHKNFSYDNLWPSFETLDQEMISIYYK